MKNFIDGARALAGVPPRVFTPDQVRVNHITPPDWLKEEKGERGLDAVYRESEQLLTWGTIVWAYIVQANVLLFKKGNDDCPACLVYSMEPYFDQWPEDLKRMATSLYELKGMDLDAMAPQLREFGRIITDQYETLFNVIVPGWITNERKVYYTTLMIHRKHLPGGVLVPFWIPLLAMPGSLQSVMVLPACYWPPELVTKWKQHQ